MTVDEELFFAWLDGELTGAEAAAMEAKVAADPALARRAEQHRAVETRLRGAFDPVAGAAVPQHLLDAVSRPMGEVIDFAAEKQKREGRALIRWAAMAAALVLGIFIGTLAPRGGGNAPVAIHGGKIYAAAYLGHALDTDLASAPGNGPVRIGITFRDQAGAMCRSFTDPQASGLACRSGDKWQVRGLFPVPEGQSDTYRMAAGMDPDLAVLVDSVMAGDAFDAAQEKAEREKGWR